MKNKIEFSDFDLKLCENIKNALQSGSGGQIAAYVAKVSRSGLSRVICFYFVDGSGKIHCINHIVSAFTGTKTSDGRVRVRGCGMDMIFASICDLLKGLGVKYPNRFAKYTML